MTGISHVAFRQAWTGCDSVTREQKPRKVARVVQRQSDEADIKLLSEKTIAAEKRGRGESWDEFQHTRNTQHPCFFLFLHRRTRWVVVLIDLMRTLAVSHSPSWLSRNQTDPPSLDTRPPKTPASKNSALKGFQSVFQRKPPRSPSAVSLLSSDSFSDHLNHHPYAAMPPPLPVVSNHDTLDDEHECPVCLEPLSFSFRLPGEKPHVVPECGHSLHEVRPQIAFISHSHLPL